jgi:addiction module HigA family antidote
MLMIPTNRAPTPPGEMLRTEFLEPMGISQAEAARAMGIPFQRLNAVVRGRRAVTPSTALRLARYLGTTPDLWLNLQRNADLHAALEAEHDDLVNIVPVDRAA